MPVEIKELVIRAVVDDSSGNEDMPENVQSSDRATLDRATLSTGDIDAIVENCVRQVLKIMKRQQDR